MRISDWSSDVCSSDLCAAPGPDFDPSAATLTLNRWIAGGVAETAAAVTAALEEFKFDQAAHAVYQFTWPTFSGWYLEFAKPFLQGDDEAAKAETRAVARSEESTGGEEGVGT